MGRDGFDPRLIHIYDSTLSSRAFSDEFGELFASPTVWTAYVIARIELV